jgi:hypothetical protein
MQQTLSKQLKKPQITQKHASKIQWLNNPRNKKAIRVGRYKEYWVVSQKDPASPLLVYNQNEWDAFTKGVKDKKFDYLIENKRG